MNTPHRRTTVVLAGLTALTIGACSSSRPDLPAAVSKPATTASAAPPATTGPPPACGNPVASLAPSGPLPAARQMPPGTLMAAIAARGRLVVGVDAATKLFSARNPQTGQLEGFDIDVLRLVAAAIFGDPDRIEYRVIQYAQRLPVLENSSVDVVADTMTINCARWARISFSSEYFAAGQKVMVRRDSKATGIRSLAAAHAKVCAPKGSTNIDNLKAYPGVQAVGVDDLGSCLVLFQDGSVDAVSADDTVLAGFASEDPYAKIVGPRFTDEPYGLGINRNYPEFVRFVNAVLERARADGTWKRLYARWLGTEGGVPEPPPALYGRAG